MGAIKIKPVSLAMIPGLYQAFLQAFADYSITINLDPNQFQRRFLEKLQLDFQHSAVAVHGNQIVGFIFNHLGWHQGKKTAYNGGTGVVPEFRGKGLTAKMYDFLLPGLKTANVEQCLLEVITTNLKAMHVYKKIGFGNTKLFRCYKFEPENYTVFDWQMADVMVYEQKEPEWEIYQSFKDIEPSYLDRDIMIKNNLKNEKIIEAVANGRVLGYAIYQRENGRLSQIAIHPKYRDMGIGKWLLSNIYRESYNKKLSILNINDEYKPLNAFFKALGFKNEINQHEMIMSL